MPPLAPTMEVEGGNLLLGGAEVEVDASPEVAAPGALLVDGHDRVGELLGPEQGLLDVEVVVQPQLALLLVPGGHRPHQLQHLRQRGQALLPVEDQVLGGNCGWPRQLHAFDRADLEARLATGLKEHDRADGERTCDADEECADVLVVPHPPTLEVRKLDLPLNDLLKEPTELGLGRVESHHEDTTAGPSRRGGLYGDVGFPTIPSGTRLARLVRRWSTALAAPPTPPRALPPAVPARWRLDPIHRLQVEHLVLRFRYEQGQVQGLHHPRPRQPQPLRHQGQVRHQPRSIALCEMLGQGKRPNLVGPGGAPAEAVELTGGAPASGACGTAPLPAPCGRRTALQPRQVPTHRNTPLSAMRQTPGAWAVDRGQRLASACFYWVMVQHVQRMSTLSRERCTRVRADRELAERILGRSVRWGGAAVYGGPMTTSLAPPSPPTVLQLVRQVLEMAAPPGLQNVDLSEAFEVLQLKAATLAAEVLLAERNGVSLSDAVNDDQSFPYLAHLHTFCADILTLQIPPELLRWARDLHKRPPDAAVSDGIQLQLGHLATNPETSAAERALARIALFEWVRLGLALVEHQTEGKLALLDIRRRDLDSIAEEEVGKCMEAARIHGNDLRPVNLALAQAMCVLDQNVETLKSAFARIDEDTVAARDRRAQIEKLLQAMDTKDAILMRNVFHEDLEEQRVEVTRLQKLHPEVLGGIKRDAIYKRVERLKGRLEEGDRLERTSPALVDLALGRDMEGV
jgi:hypothetical protein